jgi:hypothetical protein
MRNESVALTPLAICAGLLLPTWAFAQQRTAPVAAGPEYEREGTGTVFGNNWRVLWTTPVTVPVLDLDQYAGGLKPIRHGGRQSETLHFEGADGRRYVFRSVPKFLHKEALPPDVRHTFVGDIVQDQVSALFPSPALITAPMSHAVGLLHAPSELVVMPDDPRLGEHRQLFGGMLGQFEENPNEGPDGTPGFGGSRKIVDPDKFLELLDESGEHRIESREYLAARLLDFMLGDTDRGGDQWKLARFESDMGYVYRPIPRDHDFAFMRGDGLINRFATRLSPKIAYHGPTFPSLRTLTFMTTDMDRRLLVEVPRATWDSVVRAVQSQLSDPVLLTAVERMPSEYQPHSATRIFTDLRARRSGLPDVAADFYAMINAEADVHATAESERAEIHYLDDGSVDVRLYRGGSVVAVNGDGGAQPAGDADQNERVVPSSAPYFWRQFVPAETREVRVHMQGGADHVTLGGTRSSKLVVRIIGGAGADVLVDASTARAGAARPVFYADDTDRIDAGTARVDTKPYDDRPPGRPFDLQVDSAALQAPGAAEARDNDAKRKLRGREWQDWGSTFSIKPTIALRRGAGVVVGGGPTYTRYGFRREPYELKAQLRALVGLNDGRFGLEFEGDYHPENSNRGVSLLAHASQLEFFRFYGYGNDSPISEGDPRVGRDELMLHPSVYWKTSRTLFGVGPVLKYGKPNFDAGSPLDEFQPFGAGAVGQLGAAATLEVGAIDEGVAQPRGVQVELGSSAYPAFWDISDPFFETHGVVRAYVPVPGLSGPFAALRVGGQRVFGTFPVHEAAFLGGRRSLRGFRTDRFAGDASLYGGAQLHLPVGQFELLTRGRLGVFGLADAGRVYFDGASPSGWHTAFGGGATFTTLRHTLSLTYARGELGRFYIEVGYPF